MSIITLRRTGAFLASAGLLASLTVATVAAPAAAGKCEEWTGSGQFGQCYYVGNTPIDASTNVNGFTLNGTSDDESVQAVRDIPIPGGGVYKGVFNGGGGADSVIRENRGTFNGGSGDESVKENVGTFNGGTGDDSVEENRGTFNGGPGDDSVTTMVGGTFAGGAGSDVVEDLCGDALPLPDVWSADIVKTIACFE